MAAIVNPMELLNLHLGRAAAGAVIGGSGAIAYNNFIPEKPHEFVLDEKGRPMIDPTTGQSMYIVPQKQGEVNPWLAAAAGAGLGFGSCIVQNNVQDMMFARRQPQAVANQPDW